MHMFGRRLALLVSVRKFKLKVIFKVRYKILFAKMTSCT